MLCRGYIAEAKRVLSQAMSTADPLETLLVQSRWVLGGRVCWGAAWAGMVCGYSPGGHGLFMGAALMDGVRGCSPGGWGLWVQSLGGRDLWAKPRQAWWVGAVRLMGFVGAVPMGGACQCSPGRRLVVCRARTIRRSTA